MTELQNISRHEVFISVANQLVKHNTTFDVQRFEDDLLNGTELEPFWNNRQKAQLLYIECYPIFIFRRKDYKTVMLHGGGRLKYITSITTTFARNNRNQ